MWLYKISRLFIKKRKNVMADPLDVSNNLSSPIPPSALNSNGTLELSKAYQQSVHTHSIILLIGTFLLIFVILAIICIVDSSKLNNIIGGGIVSLITMLGNNITNVFGYIFGGSSDTSKIHSSVVSQITTPPTPQ
jgi:hypothetical protein